MTTAPVVPAMLPEEPKWTRVHSIDEMEAFYRSALPKMRDAAKQCGYALAVHGSMRRDLDLIAAPWVEEHSDRDELARAIQKAACGFTMADYQWEADPKPCGRSATSFPICWTEWHDMISAGHVDLAVMPDSVLALRHGALAGVRVAKWAIEQELDSHGVASIIGTKLQTTREIIRALPEQALVEKAVGEK